MALSALQIMQTYPLIKDDPDLTTYIELARLQTSACFYGSKYELAVALRAAHNLVISKPKLYGSIAQIQGARASRRLKDQSESYFDGGITPNGGTTSAGNKLLASTVYGQQLLQLMTMAGPSLRVIGAPSFCNGSG